MDKNEVFEKLTAGLVEIYGDLLDRILLYGSVARGTEDEESDVDIAVLLKSGETKEMSEKMLDLVVDLELECDRVLSVLRIDYDKFTEWQDVMPFYKNVKKDGIVLWQAA